MDVFEVFSLQGYCKSDLLLGDDYLSHREKHENINSYSAKVVLRDFWAIAVQNTYP